MDKKIRRQIIIKIGDLLDNTCKACEHNNSYRKNNDICNNRCSTGKELIRLGKLMDGEIKIKENEPMEMTKQAYESMSKEGKTDAIISKVFGVSQASLFYQKKKWYGDTPKKEKVVKEETTSKTVSLEQYKNLQQELDRSNELLKTQAEELDNALIRLSNIGNVESAYNTARSRIAQLEGLVDELAEEKYNLILENVNKLKHLEEENKHLRQVLKLVL